MKTLIFTVFVILFSKLGCATDVCETNGDCAPNKLCVDSGGVLFGGKECVHSSGPTSIDAGFDQTLPDSDLAPDASTDQDSDSDLSDVGVDLGPDLSCGLETDLDLCSAADAECGLVSALDSCGEPREVFCGVCRASADCMESQCSCVPETEEAFCLRLNASCDSLSGVDNCGAERVADCGTCIDQPCGVFTSNLCGCPCEIDGVCYPENAVSPNNPCTSCQPTLSSTNWSPRIAGCDDGNPCTIGDFCDDGACSSGTARDCSAFDSVNSCLVGKCSRHTGACFASADALEKEDGICIDINECETDNGGCDFNATCTNTYGSFDCECNLGFAGDGFDCLPAVPEITHSVQASAIGQEDMMTPPIQGSSEPTLYLAFISIRTTTRLVEDIDELGLIWSRQARQCNRDGSEHLEVWMANGIATTGPVTIDIDGLPWAAAATVLRVSGADATNLDITKMNENTNGTCEGGAQSSSYLYNANQIAADNLMVAVTTTLGTTHTDGTGWKRHSAIRAANQGNATRHFVMFRTTNSRSSFPVSGTFGASTHWASVNVTIQRP